MPNREEKKQIVEELKDKLNQVKAAIFTDYRGLNVEEITELRKQLREAGIEYKVVKNTLTRIAAKDINMDFLEEYLNGPTAIAFSFEDPVTPAKILSKFANSHKALDIKAGLVEGKLIDVEGIKALADLPSREVLIAKVIGGMQAPISGLVGVLNGPMRGLVYALKAIQDKKSA
ncbi:50S ribosomal protein L10 [Koleobacter methoxysyntrophicus]|uniref:Large ribosomal subunit protein uL10 n=1 Tax=Koleobacter methoxysyntrophicus TaxID=2751313 RepID=A0A8A0RND7_9FIRM|nr:50S ribosomal protein L10 [Koleobacter methoxysyntrophicus]QSQ08957.1 50S ribosomal protein L10 [Koleobacter methoxysyntrophicus]